VLVTAPPGDQHRIFVVEQTGAIRIVEDGQLLPTPFLDLRGKIKFSSEPGLLSIAFAPDYPTSGFFYVFYNSTATAASSTRTASSPSTRTSSSGRS
jgi:hypothetical protein